MKKLLVCIIMLKLAFGLMLLQASDAGQDRWQRVSPGEYKGYAEMYVVKNGSYFIEGDTNLGIECFLLVSEKGVSWNGDFFAWDHPGLQASREVEKGAGLERINFRGRMGQVVVVDLTVEQPKGTIQQVIRMALAPDTEKAATNKHEKAHAHDDK